MTIASYVRRHSFVATVVILVLLGGVVIFSRSGKDASSTMSGSGLKKVVLVDAVNFRKGSGLVMADGIVESRGQADLKSQVSAPISSIKTNIGGRVSAGEVILELENADLRAQLEQAKASLALAQGQYETGGVSLESAKSSAIDKIRDSYNKGSEIVNAQIDPILENNDGNGGRLSSMIIDSTLNNRITSTRVDLTFILGNWKAVSDKLTVGSETESIVAAIALSEKNLSTIDGLLSDISKGLNDAAKYATTGYVSSINTWKATVATARSTVSLLTTSLIGANSALTGSNATYDTTAVAQVSLAEAGVKNLEAQLSKTIIRSPIDGKVAGLPLGVGELATPGALVATVIGEEGLEVKAYASGEDLDLLQIGSPATISGKITGTVRSVAPSLSSSNKKIEVIVFVNENNSGLKIGQNVQVYIQGKSVKSPTADGNSKSQTYILPIQDIKIIPGEAYVYTVRDSRIETNPVILGEVRGDFIEVLSGLTDDMRIVSPVYELDPGQEVEISQ